MYVYNKILIFGSSISWGAWGENGGWVRSLANETLKDTIDSNYKNNNMVYNMSISGGDTSDMVKRFGQESMFRFSPEDKVTVIFEVGINDSKFLKDKNDNQVPISQYASNLSLLINKSKEFSSKTIFIGAPAVVDDLLSPSQWGEDEVFTSKSVEKYNQETMKACNKNDLTYIDIFSEFKKNAAKFMAPDGLHPNSKGHQVYFDKIYPILKDLKVI